MTVFYEINAMFFFLIVFQNKECVYMYIMLEPFQ